ncbi:MAG: hypothetical protein QXK26_02335, partial [Candidatus Bathyarchaeia archaeon]
MLRYFTGTMRDHFSAESFPGKTDIENKDTEDTIKQEEEFFKRVSALGNILVGDRGYIVKIDPQAKTFAFDHKTKTVYVSPQLSEKLSLTDAEKLFVFLHELGHLVQLFQDPDTYLQTIETIPQERASSFSDQPAIQEFVRRAWFSFYNVFFDIHDNSIVKYRTPQFQTEEGRMVPIELYRKAVATEKLKEEGLCDQFLYALLRKIMDPQAEIQVEEKIQRILEQETSYLGDQFSSLYDAIRELVSDPSSRIDEVSYRIEKLLVPIFEKLISEDIKKGKTMLTIEQILQDMDQGISSDTIKEILKGHQEISKSSSERLRENIESDIKSHLKSAGYSERQAERIFEIMRRTSEIYESLVDLWKIFLTVSQTYKLEETSPFYSGSSVSVRDFIKQLPRLLTQPETAKIFQRRLLEASEETIKPKKISLYLILDLSGSMDKPKRGSVQEVAYAISKSLVQFLRHIQMELPETTKSPISINVNCLGFGGSVIDLLPKTETEKQKRVFEEGDLDERIWQMIFGIEKDLGGTEDDKPLEEVEKDINLALSEGTKIEVYCRAIQITGSVYNETAPK